MRPGARIPPKTIGAYQREHQDVFGAGTLCPRCGGPFQPGQRLQKIYMNTYDLICRACIKATEQKRKQTGRR